MLQYLRAHAFIKIDKLVSSPRVYILQSHGALVQLSEPLVYTPNPPNDHPQLPKKKKKNIGTQ